MGLRRTPACTDVRTPKADCMRKAAGSPGWAQLAAKSAPNARLRSVRRPRGVRRMCDPASGKKTPSTSGVCAEVTACVKNERRRVI